MRAWLAREDASGDVGRFRRALVSIWLGYDVLDVLFGLTERSLVWSPHARSPWLLVLQIGLIASQWQLLVGKRIYRFGMLAAALRLAEALTCFSLNDFYFYGVVMAILAHEDGGPFREGARRPAWVRDALLVQLGFVYLATATLKLSPDWLSGGHLYVRTHYLARALDWPYPAWLMRRFDSLAFDSLMARVGAGAELALGAVLVARRPYWLGVALVVGIHTVGALITNVWFFSATMIAAVMTLLPRRGSVLDGAADERKEEQ